MMGLNSIKRPNIRKPDGFSLVELLTVLIIVGIIVAIALPNFYAVRKNALTAATRGNMRTTQTAAESYCTDTGGVYGAITDVMPYYPGGALKLGGSAGDLPDNPVTKVLNEVPITGGPTTGAQIQTLRGQIPSAFGGPGQHSYDVVDGGEGYAVCGCDANIPSNYLSGAGGKVLVLSNR